LYNNLRMAALQSAARAFTSTARVWLRDGSSGGVVTALGGPAFAAALGRTDIVFAGETHEQPDVLRLQMGLLEAVIAQRPHGLHLVLEHWTFDEQAQLDAMLADPGAGGDRVTATGLVGIHAVARFCARVAAGAGVPLRGYAAFPAREVARAFLKPETAGAAWGGFSVPLSRGGFASPRRRVTFSERGLGVVSTAGWWDARAAVGSRARLALVLAATDADGLWGLLRLAEPTIPPMTRAPFSNLFPDVAVASAERLRRGGADGLVLAGFYDAAWELAPEASYVAWGGVVSG
jgi:hypothetical protein